MIFKALFGTCKRRISRASGGFAPCTPTRALLWTCWGAYSAPQTPAGFSNDLWSLHLVPTTRDCHTGAEGGGGVSTFINGYQGGSTLLFFTAWGHRIFCKLYPFIASPPPDINNDPSLILASVSWSLLIIESVARVSQHVLFTHVLLVKQVSR